MSSLIDDLIFQKSIKLHTHAKDRQKQQILLEICKRINFNDESAIICLKDMASVSYNRIQLQHQSFLIKLRIQRQTQSFRVEVVLLPSWSYQKIASKQQQLMVIKQLTNHHKQLPAQASFYIENCRITMIITNCNLFIENVKKTKLVEFYQHLIIKNILNFQNIVNKYLRIQRKNYRQIHREIECFAESQQKLYLTQIIDTAHSVIDFSEEKMEFTFARETLNKQKQDFKEIQKNVIGNEQLQVINRSLFKYYPMELTAAWVKQNFRICYQKGEKRMNSLLKLTKRTTQKSIEEYIYNMVKIQIKQIIQKPIGVGGFSLIYVAKAALSFISSADHSTYQRNQPKMQRMIAIKKMRGEDKKQKQKIQHQKTIISKLRGSCSYFIPKYYAIQKGSQLSNVLFMQLIQGEELDHFISSNIDTMSIWTKIYILLNVIHGMRHLNIYNIVHLDLKPINILVCKFLIIKIIDFGQAYHKDVCNKNYVPGFTFPYCAPQIYIRFLKMSYQKGQEQFSYCQKQDVFSFGMIMFEVLFNARIFSFTPSKYKQIYVKKQILQRIFFAGEKLIDFGVDSIYSTLMQIIIRCIDPNPQRRPRFDWIGIALKIILNFYGNNI